jgi:hypothetical protein
MLKTKNFKSLILLLSFLIFQAVGLLAQQTVVIPEIQATADKTTVHVGDIIKYEVVFKLPQEAEIKFSDPKTINSFSIRDFQEQKRKDKDNAQIITRDYELVIFEVGEFSIENYSVEYRIDPEQKWQKLTAQPIQIKVESVLEPDTPDLEAKPLKPKLVIWRDFWGWVIGLLIIGLIVLAFWILKKYLQAKQFKPKVVLPAHVIALKELEEIEKDNLIVRGFIKEFFERLSACIRRYLENRFGLRAPWMSTEEFLIKAKTSPILTTEQKHLLHGFLSLSDMVKFARYSSSDKEARDSFMIIRNFIEQTKLAEDDDTKKIKQ